MRFEQLILERFGHFEGLRLDLSGPDVLLHVVHGPNEAGKSTALAAICDLLFGFPRKSPYNFIHPYARLRLGATLSNSAGHSLSFKRRKADTRTLLAEDESADLPDHALAPFLGTMTRDTFERMFGLNHDRLRAGGKAMLDSGGDLARSLFEAGSGTAGLSAIMAALNTDADAIGAPSRRVTSRPYWQALDRFDAANDQMRAESLKAEAWSAAEKAVEAARSRRGALDSELADLRRQRTVLDRIRRTTPHLRRLDQLRAQLAPMVDGPTLPDDFEDTWRTARGEVDTTAAQSETQATRLTEARAVLAGLDHPGPWIGAADAIEILATDLGDYRTKRTDLPHRLRDLENGDRQMLELMRQLGTDSSPAEMAKRRPSEPTIARIRALITTGTRLDSAFGTAESEHQKSESLVAEAEQAVAMAGAPANPAEAIAALASANALGDTANRLAKARLEAEATAAQRDRTLSALGRWTGSAETLAATAFVEADSVARVEQRMGQVEAEINDTEQVIAKAKADLTRIEGELTSLRAGGDVPTAAVLDSARHRRDHGWRIIRRRHLEGIAVPDDEVAGFAPDGDLAGVYEGVVAAADHLADRRQREAARIERFALLCGDEQTARQTLVLAQSRRQTLTERRTDLGVEWRNLWQPSGVVPDDPPQMRGWLAAKDRVLVQIQAAQKAASLCDTLLAEDQQARAHLLRAARGLPGADRLDTAALRDKVQASCAQAESAYAQSRTLVTDLASRRRDCESRARELEQGRRQLDGWRESWAGEMPGLGLRPTSQPEEAEAALAVWQRISVVEADLDQTRRRRDQISDAIALYEANVRAVLGDLGEHPAVDADASVLVPELQQRLAASRSAATRQDQAQAAVKAAEAAADSVHQAGLRAAVALKTLMASHGLADESDVVAMARASSLRRRLDSEIADTERDVMGQGDGLDEAALRLAASAVDFDSVAGEIDRLEAEFGRLQNDLQHAAQDVTVAEADLRQILGRAGIGAAAQAANDAAAEMVAHVERWLRIRAAGMVLNRAVERYRAVNQHPLVRRASELFQAMAALAPNPITRLSVDYTDEDRPSLVGFRGDGSLCPVSGMSEGTLDQLYLALRIAAIERGMDGAEPMPFIADDLFITSDEDRTLAGIGALAELGKATQVLLFTHHRYVVDAVTTALPAGRAKVHRLREV
jgi:chromosome segregation protein